MDFRPSTRPASVTQYNPDGTPITQTVQEGPTVTTSDRHVFYVAPDHQLRLAGVTYDAGHAIQLTLKQGADLAATGAVLPLGTRPKQVVQTVMVGRIQEADVATQLRAGVRLEGH